MVHLKAANLIYMLRNSLQEHIVDNKSGCNDKTRGNERCQRPSPSAITNTSSNAVTDPQCFPRAKKTSQSVAAKRA